MKQHFSADCFRLFRLYIEKISAKDTERPLLEQMFEYVREGDTVYIKDSVVWSPPHLDDSFIMMVLEIQNMLNTGNIKDLYKLIRRWDYDSIKNIQMLANQIRGIYADRLAGVK